MPRRKPRDPERSADLPHDWIERHINRIEQFVYYDVMPVEGWQYRRAKLVAAGTYEDIDTDWQSIKPGALWGGEDTTVFFRTHLNLPPDYATADTALDIALDGGEAQLSINGYPYQGMDWYRSIVPIGEFAQSAQELMLDIEAFIINYPYDERRHDERIMHRFERANLLKIDRAIEAFVTDARLVLNAYLSYWQDDSNFELENFLRHHLETACREIGVTLTTQAEARAAAIRAHNVLKETIFETDVYKHAGCINVCGHSHLDIVYLWSIKETFRKNCRTTTNMLSLMREYPEFRYSQSQPFLYEKLKEMYPDVYEEVRQRVKEGRWEIIGAMYVEPDGNLPGAESFVRQILFGKRFIQQEFGVDVDSCWLPDVFGVVYTLPQILRKSGVKYFSTVKLNVWNDTNTFPHDTFRWRGPDGSEVITHFPPTHFAQDYTYSNLRRQWQDFRERDSIGENLFVYGWGDGGGGPTREMVATSLRTTRFPGLPGTQIDFVQNFFQRLEQKADQLPVWDDELYLEAHRGTYTTKGDLKQQNRQSELLYRDTEILAAIAWLFGAERMQDELNQGWKHVLLNQFHDTLPGTHRPETVPDIKKDYEIAFKIGQDVRSRAVTYLVNHLDTETIASNDLLLINTLSWQRDALISIETEKTATAIRTGEQSTIPVQHYDGKAWFHASELPSMGWTTACFENASEQTAVPTLMQSGNVIETALYRIVFAEDGTLAQIHDKRANREVLAAPGNVFQVFEDDPGTKFSAWDIAYHVETYQHPVAQVSAWQLVENGAVFAVLRSRWQVLNSTIEQELWLYADNPRIEFRTRVDWRDRRKLLKVAFPLKVRTRHATYDLPFGNIERATHCNTDFERARFEVCGHKWADLSEGNYGVALLNDCKYGYDARENVLRLSLLRSPVRPDPHSDIGEHTFNYALLPHQGNWRDAQVDRAAYDFNIPALATAIPQDTVSQKPHLPPTGSLISDDSDSLIVEAIKHAEDSDALILRTFDSHGNHSHVQFASDISLNTVAETDLMETSPQPVTLTTAQRFSADYTPYEIKTHRLDFARD